jgi:hypothetical protein
VACVRARGDGRPWRVGVLDPRDRNRCRFSVRLSSGGGIASSGDYERCFVQDGRRYHHLLDARTGWPACGVAGTTVVAGNAFEAGMAATAAFLLAKRGCGIWGMPRARYRGGRRPAACRACSAADLPGSFTQRIRSLKGHDQGTRTKMVARLKQVRPCSEDTASSQPPSSSSPPPGAPCRR